VKNLSKILIPILILAVVSAIVLTKKYSQNSNPIPKIENKEAQADSSNQSLPMLVDLGRGTCVPCKMMKPILEELTAEYQGKAIVKYIDIRYEPEKAKFYKIRLIPTQIFFDKNGNEVFRHEGFMDKESIKKKFLEMGIN
jgi:thioredoxin 1